jgi:FG-GAP-like repeat
MTTISLGQTITGSFSSSTPKLNNGAYYYDYDLPNNLTSLSEITIAFDPVNSANFTNTPGSTTLDLINASTGAILAESTSAYGTPTTYTGYLGLIDKTVAPGVSYKIRVYNSSLSNGNFSLSLTNQGQATSLVSRGYLNFNGTADTQIGTLTAAGRYFPLGSTYIGVSDVALSASGLLYGISPSTGNYSADKLYVIDPSIGLNPPSTSVSDLLDTSGNILLQSFRSLAFAGNQLYAIGTSAAGAGSLYQIDVNTKVATLVTPLPLGFNNSGDLVYDAPNNRFLASSADTGVSDALWQIPLANPASTTKLGPIGFLNVRGLAVENGQITGYTPATGVDYGTNKITINASTGAGTFSQNLPNFSDITGAATIVPLTTTVRNDFNGDGKSDILWRNDYGDVALWQMNGATVTAGSFTSVPNIDQSWKVAGTGDFNGDAKSDVLWRNTNGRVVVWTMDGSTVLSSSLTSTPSIDNSWKTVGTGDYNGDGKADILWRNDNGSIAIWTMDGSTVKSSSKTSTAALDPSWKVASNSDFNGDGKADILWRNDDGSVALWQMDGAKIKSSTAVAKVSTDWKIAGTGDFNGDGKADILWRNDNGTIALWQMDGATLVAGSQTSTSSLDSSWNVAGIGDYNGDRKADILWRNTGGAAVVWTMDGSNVVSSTLTSVAADGNGWKIAAPMI